MGRFLVCVLATLGTWGLLSRYASNIIVGFSDGACWVMMAIILVVMWYLTDK